MKKIFSLILYLAPFACLAQGVLSGAIQEENSTEMLVGAQIHLAKTSFATLADEHGNFTIKNIPVGTYDLEITFVGYQLFSQPVTIQDNQVTKLKVNMKPGDIQLGDVTVTASAQQSINTLSALDIKLRPTNTSQDILRMVPGLFIAQHAGGGKAEQIFLRGFDIDHGTDLNLEVDGLPVNMVSHAHGQGYSDLHFIIPEVVNYVDFNKGPYYADKGDFATAGYVDFQTKNSLERNFVKLEGGQFGTARGVVGVKLGRAQQSRTSGYVASEFFGSNGYVESPQHFKRVNVMSKITSELDSNDKLTFGSTFFMSNWHASGQIPTRAVEEGTITRFGSIDNTEGGETSRINLYIKHLHQLRSGAYFSQQAYAVRYTFDLFSNFTFFLNDPVNGDQIEQKESRMIYGYKANYNSTGTLLNKTLKTEVGTGFRIDDVNAIRLSHTVKREFLGDIKRGNVDEANLFGYVNETLSLTDKWSVNAALRFDYFNFRYTDALRQTASKNAKALVSPKLSVNYQLNSKTQLYLRTGYGFHSNDARTVTQQDVKNLVPRAVGIDVGVNSKLTDDLLVNVALWRLDLEQEFVYVGDEGVIEPSGRTQREGIDISVRYQLLPWLFFDSDVNLTKPKAKDLPDAAAYIPLAPTFSSIGGLSFRMKNGFNGSLRYRHLGDRAANEDKSVIAHGYTLADAMVNYTRPKFEVGVSAENLFNVDWNEAQFDTTSRLTDEVDPVSEIHFTPGTPLFVKLRFSFFF